MSRRAPSLVLPFSLALLLAACAQGGDTRTSSQQMPQKLTPTMPAPAAAPTDAAPAADHHAAPCDAAPAQAFVGKQADEATVAAARKAAGAKGDLRVIKPGQPVTMDYRIGRLNVEVDEHNTIVRINCG